MNTAEAEQRVRALAGAADLPRQFEAWPGVQERVPHLRQRRTAARVAVAAVAVLAIAAAIVVPLSAGPPQSAQAAVRRAAAVARTGTGLPPLELTEVTATKPVGFQPEPPPPLVTDHIQYADPAHWRDQSIITEPFSEGIQAITRIRNGSRIATVAGGRVTITRASGPDEIPFPGPVTGPGAALRKLLAAGSAGGCAPHASLGGSGPLIDGRPTMILRLGPSPCPSADFPQANGPATFWLDRQTLLVLRAVLHSQDNRVAETIRVTGLRYHVSFPAGTFRLPAPSPPPPACPAAGSLPDLAALRRALAYLPLLPAPLPGGLRTGPISSGATAGHCKISSFTVTYLNPAGRPAVQLYEAPRASPSVRFPGRTVTIRPGLTGTVNISGVMTILWWIQDGRYCSLQSGGLTTGVRLSRVPVAVLIRMAASFRG